MRLNKSNDCEFKHDNEKKLAEADSTNKYKTDIKALKADILKLKVDVQKKTSELDKLSNQITKGYKIVKEKDNEMSKMEETLQDKNEEIARVRKELEENQKEMKEYVEYIEIQDKEMQDKNEEISSLKKELALNKRSTKVSSKPLFGLKCTTCKFIADSDTILKTHIEIKHCTCNICKEAELTSSPKSMTCPKCTLVLYCGTTMIAHSKAQHG
jgi:uncharacterized phage infection (PIP) family protein YhgE